MDPDIQDHLEPLENAISHVLIPAITKHDCNQSDRKILTLSVCLGGLGFTNPCCEAKREYTSSVTVTKPLVEKIVSQTQQLRDEPPRLQVSVTSCQKRTRQITPKIRRPHNNNNFIIYTVQNSLRYIIRI